MLVCYLTIVTARSVRPLSTDESSTTITSVCLYALPEKGNFGWMAVVGQGREQFKVASDLLKSYLEPFWHNNWDLKGFDSCASVTELAKQS